MTIAARRTKRGQPIVVEHDDGGAVKTGDPVYTRKTDTTQHLAPYQVDKLDERAEEDDEHDANDLRTEFFESFSRETLGDSVIRRENKVYGKQKIKQTTVSGYEEFKLGDTVLVDVTSSKKPSVGVVVSIWRVAGAGREGEPWTNVRIHWFSRPSDLAAHRERRDALENEVYYQLSGTSIVSPSAILGHCTVLAHPTESWSPDEKTFVCLKALHPRRNLYYEFNWDEFHTSALAATSAPEPGPSTSALPDASIWERTDQWDVFPDETPFTPKKPKRPSGYTYVRGTRAGREGSDDEDDLLPAIREEDEDHVSSPASPSKRKRGIHAASAGRRGKRARHENDQDVSSSEDEGDASENYEHDLAQNDEAEDDHILDADAVLSGDDASLTPSDAESDMIYPRTPSKRNKRAAALRTPSKRRGPARAAPTPHSKAALRARANRTRTRQLAVRPPPGPGAALDDEFDLASVGDDPWLRAMHVLHVAARPEGTGSRLPCRDAEYTRVLGAVEELIEEGSGGCVYISGVPGTGKTATVHAVVRELQRAAEGGEAAPFTFVEINGLRIPEPAAAYALLWEAVSGHDARREGHLRVSPKEALRSLSRHFAGAGGPRGHACVVLMDELDQLMTTKQDVVYNFFNWPTLAGSKLVVLAVANTMDLPERVMSGRVRSRLGMVRINFQPYTTPQLEQIVRARLASAKAGLPPDAPDVVAPDAIKFAAMKVSSISGDARRVLDICRRAVELVQPARRAARADDVKTVIKDMQNSPTAAYVRELAFHERLMLAALLRVVKREGVDAVRWGDIQHQHALHVPVLGDGDEAARRPTRAELAMVRDALAASRAVLCEDGPQAARKAEDERRVVLNLEFAEVERVLGEVGGARWRNVLNI